MDEDILIRNGTVMDGTGASAVKADLIIREDRIEDLGSFPDARVGKVIDAQGLAVAPGFIDVHTLSQEEAVRKMTSLPARQMQLEGRGVLKKGAFADITVFDPGTVKSCASFEDPHRFAEGIEYVLINGKPVLERGSYDARALAGTVIKRS
jgi:N-acyl-D-aspartate/D-glutamate deacylase